MAIRTTRRRSVALAACTMVSASVLANPVPAVDAPGPAGDRPGAPHRVGDGGGAAPGECGTVLTPGEAEAALALEQAGAYVLPDAMAIGVPVEVPLTFHVVRTSDGSGGIAEDQLVQALEDANAAFAEAGISFCLPGPTRYIDSDAFYFEIDTLAEVNALRSTDPVVNTINVYCTENVAIEAGSLCGISSFTFSIVQGIVMNNACMGLPSNPSTFPHEIGHYLDLFHTHETAFGVECVDGSNCDVAGDLLCDTPADPNVSGQVTRWPDCAYNGDEPGPCSGDLPYAPDTSNFMSYSQKQCRTNFSAAQGERALAALFNLRPQLIDACECPESAYERLYVSTSAPPGGDGGTWESAFGDVQQALAVAACPQSAVTEIWVAAGVFAPAGAGGTRTATFQLISGVELYGHFAGWEKTVDERDLANPDYETILTGDLNGDDGLGQTYNGENAYHVATGSGTNSTAVLDGFTITGGNADGEYAYLGGGGMLNVFGSPTVRNCVFVANAAVEGGGMRNWTASPSIIDCTFTDNVALYGAGMENLYDAKPTISGCSFVANATLEDGSGGGMLNFKGASPLISDCFFSENFADEGGGMQNWTASPTIIDCVFANNVGRFGAGMENFESAHPSVLACTFEANATGAGGSGGGILNFQDCSPVIVNCLFADNQARIWGGGIMNWTVSSPDVVNCTLVGNGVTNNGGGMASTNLCAPTMSNSIVWNNVPNEIADLQSSEATVRYSNVQGGWPGDGNIDEDPLFDDGLRPGPGSPCIDAADNDVVPVGVTTDLDGNPRFVDDPGTEDTGIGSSPIVDMGAYELQADTCTGDLNGDGAVDGADIGLLLGNWNGSGLGDINGDGTVDGADLGVLLGSWGSCA